MGPDGSWGLRGSGLHLHTPAISKHILLIRKEKLLGFVFFFFVFFLADLLPRYHYTPRYQLYIRAVQLFLPGGWCLIPTRRSKPQSSWTVVPSPSDPGQLICHLPPSLHLTLQDESDRIKSIVKIWRDVRLPLQALEEASLSCFQVPHLSFRRLLQVFWAEVGEQRGF